jgi:TetR/AcrR family fatty acid metabolism transcriptional regulator
MAASAYPEGREQALARAALAVFTERGYAAAPVREIAERAGMAAGTFYLYFPSKEAVGTALIDALYRRTLAAVAERRAAAAGPLEKLERSVAAVLDAFGHDPALSRFVLVLAPGAAPAFDRRLAEVQELLTARVAEDLSEAGSGDADRSLVAARILIGGVSAAVSGWVRDGGAAGRLEAALPLLTAVVRALAGATTAGGTVP